MLGGSLRQVVPRSEACDMLCAHNSQRLNLRAFGLASYKLRGAVWTSSSEATFLQNSAIDHLKQLDVQHPDFNFFTSQRNTTRR